MGHLLDVDYQHGRAFVELAEVTQKKDEFKKLVCTRLENSLGGVGSISNITNNKSNRAKKAPVESYVAVARVSLGVGLLKKACDAIFVGKRLTANDSRLESLSLEGRKAYDLKQHAS